MSVVLRARDIEAELKKTPDAIIINNLPKDSDVDRTHIEMISSTRLNKDEKLSTVPMCACKKTKLGVNLGETCPKCGTEVTMAASSLKHELWMMAPDGVTSLISPKFMIFMMKEFQLKKNFNGFEYLLNPSHKPPRGQDRKTRLFRQMFMDLPRGVSSVIENIDEIIKRIEQFKGKNLHDLKKYREMYKDVIFPRVLPLPSRLTLLVEDTHVYTYYDRAIDKVLDSIYTIAGINEERDKKAIESRTASALINLAHYYLHILDSNIAGKPGIVRKMLLGSRLNYAMRDIVTSLHEPHDYRCPRISKSLAVIMFTPIIMSKLVARGSTWVEAYDYIKENTLKPTDILVDILYEIVEDTKPVMKEITGRDDMYGIVMNSTRYPGLRLGSSQTFLIREFSDDSIEMSVLCLRSQNCDFDGDELSAYCVLGKDNIRMALNLMPHFDIHSNRDPGSFANTMDIPATVHVNIHKRLESETFEI